MYMVMFVLQDADRLDQVLDAWRAVGVTGVTIFESIGAYTRKQKQRLVGARYAFGIGKGATQFEAGSYTLLAIVPDEEIVRGCITAAESVVGDLNEPNNGVVAAWQLDITKGIPSMGRTGGDEA